LERNKQAKNKVMFNCSLIIKKLYFGREVILLYHTTAIESFELQLKAIETATILNASHFSHFNVTNKTNTT